MSILQRRIEDGLVVVEADEGGGHWGLARGGRWFTVALAITAVHFTFLLIFHHPAISTPDASGYFGQAKLIATQGQTWFELESHIQYIPPHWLEGDDGRVFSKYPPGLPLVSGVAYRLWGPSAALLVNPLLTSLTLLGVFLVCKRWIGGGWGLLAMALMAVNPTVNSQALSAFAHPPVGFCVVWGVYFISRWADSYSLLLAFAAGVCVGAIPTVRYAEVLFGLGFALFALLHLRRCRRPVLSLVAMAAGAAPPVLALMIRNKLAFGSFFSTGYAMTDEQTGFSVSYFFEHALGYLTQLSSTGCGPLFGLGVVGIAILCARRETRRWGILLAGLVLPTTLLYMSYYWRVDDMSMRFLSPTLFLYAIAAVAVLQMVSDRHRAAAIAGSVVLLSLASVMGLPASVARLGSLAERNRALAEMTDAVIEHVEPGSLILSESSIQQQLDFAGKWRLINGTLLSQRGGRGGGPRIEAGDGFRPQMRGPNGDRNPYDGLQGADLMDAFVADVQDWAGESRRVYVILPERMLDDLAGRLDDRSVFSESARVELPPRRRLRSGGRGPGMGPGGDGPGGPEPSFRFNPEEDRSRRSGRSVATSRRDGPYTRLGSRPSSPQGESAEPETVIIAEWIVF